MKSINKKSKGISPVVAAIGGSVLGAGIAIAGAIALSKTENRKKVDEAIKKVKSATEGFVNKVKSESQDKRIEVEKKLRAEKEVVRSAAIGVVDSIDKLANKTKKQIKKI